MLRGPALFIILRNNTYRVVIVCVRKKCFHLLFELIALELPFYGIRGGDVHK